MSDASQIGKSTPFFKIMTQGIEENVKAWVQAVTHIKNGFLYIIFNNSLLQRNTIKNQLNLYQG